MKSRKLAAIMLALGIGFLHKDYAVAQPINSLKQEVVAKENCDFKPKASASFKSNYVPSPGIELGRGPVTQVSGGLENKCLGLSVGGWGNYSISDKEFNEVDLNAKISKKFSKLGLFLEYGRFWFPTNLVPDIHQVKTGVSYDLPMRLNVDGFVSNGFLKNGSKYTEAALGVSGSWNLKGYLKRAKLRIGFQPHLAIRGMNKREPVVDHLKMSLGISYPIGNGSLNLGLDYIQPTIGGMERKVIGGIGVNF
jgi:hypothetical protein